MENQIEIEAPFITQIKELIEIYGNRRMEGIEPGQFHFEDQLKKDIIRLLISFEIHFKTNLSQSLLEIKKQYENGPIANHFPVIDKIEYDKGIEDIVELLKTYSILDQIKQNLC